MLQATDETKYEDSLRHVEYISLSKYQTFESSHNRDRNDGFFSLSKHCSSCRYHVSFGSGNNAMEICQKFKR